MEGIRVHFCVDFTTARGTIIVPVGRAGLEYAISGVEISAKSLQSALESTIFGNGLFLGQTPAQESVFGLVKDDTYDEEFIWASLKNSIERIAGKANMRTVAIAPVFQSAQSEFEANVNRFLLYLVLETMKSGDLYICAAQSFVWMQELLRSVNAQLPSISLHFPVTRAQKLEEMKTHPLHCQYCFEYLEEAMMSTCCQVLFCKLCTTYQAACPVCGKSPSWQENRYARQQTAELLYVCSCEAEVLMKDLQTHKLECPLSQFKCQLCPFDWASRHDLLAHFVETHAEDLLSNPFKPRK